MASLTQIPEGLQYVYKEPTLNKNGSPLTDLDHVSIFQDIGAGPVLVLDVPASGPTGGQEKTIILPNPIGADQEANVTVYSIAIDDNGNEAVKGGEVTIPLDNLAPNPTE